MAAASPEHAPELAALKKRLRLQVVRIDPHLPGHRERNSRGSRRITSASTDWTGSIRDSAAPASARKGLCYDCELSGGVSFVIMKACYTAYGAVRRLLQDHREVSEMILGFRDEARRNVARLAATVALLPALLLPAQATRAANRA